MLRGVPRATALLFLALNACSDEPLDPLVPDVPASPSHRSGVPSASGIYSGAESFVAGNPMANVWGGDANNYGYYSDGPDPLDGVFDSDRTRIEIPHDSRLANLSDFTFESWLRLSYSTDWQYGLIAMNSSRQYNANGQNDFGYFLLDFYQWSPGLVDFNWSVASYAFSGWSTTDATAPITLRPDSGAVFYLVGVHENDVIRLYINGQLADSLDISGHSGLQGPDSQPTTGSGFRQDLTDIYSWSGAVDKPLMIGGAQFQEGDGRYLSLFGSIGEAAFYRRALTATEIEERYAVGTVPPPPNTDSAYDPYGALVAGDSATAADGYWRTREQSLHGLASLDGQQVVDASGNGWDGTYRSAASGPVFSVDVSCDSVPRATEATCTATWAPSTVSAAEIEFRWDFFGDKIRPFPNGSIQYFEPGLIADTGFAMDRWAGTAVHSGDVYVTATWNGQTDIGTARLGVSPRATFQTLPITLDTVPKDWITDPNLPLGEQPNAPFGTKTGGLALNVDMESGLGVLVEIVNGEPDLAEVTDGGPNDGLWYVAGHSLSVERGILIRTWLEGRSLATFRYFGDLLTGRGLLAQRTIEDRRDTLPEHPDSAEIRVGVRAHEKHGRNGANGHQSQMEAAARSVEYCGNIPALLDPIVADDSASLDDRANVVITEGERALAYVNSHERYVRLNYTDAPIYDNPTKVVNAKREKALRAIDSSDDGPGFETLFSPGPGTGCTRP
jgi:hypothetical protein